MKQTPDMHADCSYFKMQEMASPYASSFDFDPARAAQSIVAYHRGDWLKAWRFICHVWKLNKRKYSAFPNWDDWLDRVRQIRKHIYGLKFSSENPTIFCRGAGATPVSPPK